MKEYKIGDEIRFRSAEIQDENVEYFLPNKIYIGEVIVINPDGVLGIDVLGEDGCYHYVLNVGCDYLRGGDWEVVEDGYKLGDKIRVRSASVPPDSTLFNSNVIYDGVVSDLRGGHVGVVVTIPQKMPKPYILLTRCAHLGGGDWEVVEDQVEDQEIVSKMPEKKNFKQDDNVRIIGLDQDDQLFGKVGRVVGKTINNFFDTYIVLFDTVLGNGFSAINIPDHRLELVESKEYKLGDIVFVRTDYTNTDYIKPNKIYVGRVVGLNFNGTIGIDIIDEDDEPITIIQNGCDHIDGNAWEIINNDYNIRDTILIRADCPPISHITPNKIYVGEVVSKDGSGQLWVTLKDESGDEITTTIYGASIINNGNWEIVV